MWTGFHFCTALASWTQTPRLSTPPVTPSALMPAERRGWHKEVLLKQAGPPILSSSWDLSPWFTLGIQGPVWLRSRSSWGSLASEPSSVQWRQTVDWIHPSLPSRALEPPHHLSTTQTPEPSLRQPSFWERRSAGA